MAVDETNFFIDGRIRVNVVVGWYAVIAPDDIEMQVAFVNSNISTLLMTQATTFQNPF